MNLIKFQPRNVRFSPFTFGALDNLITDEYLGGSTLHRHNYIPKVNIAETEQHFIIELAAPGYQKSDFKIEVEKNVLIIKSEVTENANAENPKYTVKEYNFSSFNRSFNLPESANAEAINAVYNNGILTVSIAKKEEAKLIKKEITVS